MGVIKHFSSSAYDDASDTYKVGTVSQNPYVNAKYYVQPTPDPTNYEILKSIYVNGYLLLSVKYPDSDNYEGKKLLLFDKNITVTQLKKQGMIDPHFSDNKEMLSPIARFEPTPRGWKMAYKFCKLN